MIRAVSTFNKEKIRAINKEFKTKAIIISSILSLVVAGLGIFNIIAALTSPETNWLSLVLGVIITAFAAYPVTSSINTHKRNYEETVRSMRLNSGDLVLDYTVKERRIEIVATQCGKEEKETVMIKNVSLVKISKGGVGVYVGNDMYYISNEDIVMGTKESLVNTFIKAGVPVKGKLK